MDRRTVLLGSGVAFSAVLAGCAGSEDDEPAAVDDGGDESGNGSDGGNDDSADETDADETDDADADGEDVDAVIGELVEGDQMHLVVEGVERTTVLGEFQDADAGSEFVVVDLAMKNVSDEFLSVSNLLQTSVRDDEDYSYDQTIATGGGNTFNDGQFAPGEVERGILAFEVPDNAGGLELWFNFDVSLFGGVDRAHIDLESEADVYILEQDLGVDVYDVGETVEYGDVQVAVRDVEYESELGMFAQPDDGHEYAILDLEITNESGEEQRISTMLQMLIKDGEGYSYQEDFGASSELSRPLDETEPLVDGETRAGEVAYEVPADASPFYRRNRPSASGSYGRPCLP
ncbi:DUF4352 domain-containing protein [Natronolimnobius baerhuensis]|uniref:DUF4352 domain-containing protein n=1 Tax=Natronolimnobius baerhuensis TaxID=253108 RepID=A0A202E7B9_9EURY|nr:DUF4352 domain-containing protein [Natronolimnobius baerhuensis]OVE84104.1 hypothetical protein B2G88_06650 [Natronolimnobius baerhuensis]